MLTRTYREVGYFDRAIAELRAYVELLQQGGVSDASYNAARDRFGERGVVELTTLVGYFAMVSMVLNVAHTPPEPADGVQLLPHLPL